MLKLWPVLAQFTAPELWVQVEYLVRIFVAACLGLLIGSEPGSSLYATIW